MGEQPAERAVVDQPGGNVALDLFVLDQRLNAYLTAAFQGLAMTPAQYAVYAQIAGGATSPGALTLVLWLPPATLSRYLALMEDRGHLRRERGRDRRHHVLALTDAGDQAREQARRRMAEAIGVLDAELGGADAVRRIRDSLAQVHTALGAASDTFDA